MNNCPYRQTCEKECSVEVRHCEHWRLLSGQDQTYTEVVGEFYGGKLVHEVLNPLDHMTLEQAERLRRFG